MASLISPTIPIELDCLRSLKLNMNAIALWHPGAECRVATGVGFIKAVMLLERYVNTLAEFAKRNTTETLNEEDSEKLEPPASIIIGLLYCLLQHQWNKKSPEAPRLTMDEVGAFIDFQSLADVAGRVLQALAGNLAAPPTSAVAPSATTEGADGQDPLRSGSTIGMPSSPLPAASLT